MVVALSVWSDSEASLGITYMFCKKKKKNVVSCWDQALFPGKKKKKKEFS